MRFSRQHATSSLSTRLLISVSVLLLFFFGATIAVLDTAFREAGEQAQEDILDGQLMALLAAAEPNIYGELEMPVDLHEVRFSNLDSGLYGELLDDSDEPVWRSRSSLGLQVPYGESPAFGTHQFSRVRLEDGTPLMALSLAVEWELSDGELRPYTFNVAESLDSFNAQLARFRRQLFGWFAAVALIMLFSISLLMRGVLRPLRKIEEEISDIESGKRQELSDGYPTELTGVARNMNVLVGSERARSERYRNTLDNLAHSLKTPLAAIRAVLGEQQPSDGSNRIQAQIDRMNDIVRYQLRKPATYASESIAVVAVDIDTDLHRLVDGLRKVYKEKNPDITLDVAPGTKFRGDSGDFLELRVISWITHASGVHQEFDWSFGHWRAMVPVPVPCKCRCVTTARGYRKTSLNSYCSAACAWMNPHPDMELDWLWCETSPRIMAATFR